MRSQDKLILAACVVFGMAISFINVSDGGACKYIPSCNSCDYNPETKRANCFKCDRFHGKTYVNGFCRCLSCNLNNSGCHDCDDFTKCKRCRLGSDGPDNNGKATCSACSANCRTCAKIGSGQCDICNPGSKKINNKCEKCQVEHCNFCDASVSQCSTCEPGYKLEENKCIQCGANCRSCKSPTQCSYCFDYYFADDNGACSKCKDNNCKICTDVNKCRTCNTGFYPGAFMPDGSNTCEPCDESCFTCSDKKTCTICKKGKLVDGSCKCADNCKNCDRAGNGKCNECIKGYVESEGKGCKRVCVTRNCKSCNDDGQCLQCEDGYTLNSDSQCQVGDLS